MNHLSLGAGWLWLIDNKLPGDFVPVALPCWNNPPHLLTGSFQRYRYRLFLGQDVIAQGLSQGLSWPGKPCCGNPASHCTETVVQSQHLLQGTSMHAAVKTRCFITGTFCLISSLTRSPSLAFSLSFLCRQSHAVRCLQLRPAQPREIRQPVFSDQWSHLSACSSQPSFTDNWDIQTLCLL